MSGDAYISLTMKLSNVQALWIRMQQPEAKGRGIFCEAEAAKLCSEHPAELGYIAWRVHGFEPVAPPAALPSDPEGVKG